MIGLIAKPEEHEVAREFFELFKTPWEFYRPEERYDVLVCVSEELPAGSVPEVKLIIVYAGQELRYDCEAKIKIGIHLKGGTLFYHGERFPIYDSLLTFLDEQKDILEEEQSRQSAAVRRRAIGENVVRIGYDLFREIRLLLSLGQPLEYAGIPTVDVHIGLLRDLIVESDIPLVEIPPIPQGYAFIACLTHDVDHPSIRHHRWDHTAWGFLYRALIGSVLDVLRGRKSIRHLMSNWAAAARLPFVYLGLARDFWLDFDRYLSIEQHVGSTFFVLPFKGDPGRTESGSAPHLRAAGYGVTDIDDRIQAVMRDGGEIGLHGIDAWVDNTSAEGEKTQIEKVTGAPIDGVRMHWLYFNSESPVLLEKAGFAYDSTVGYNETVGYRAGTTQVYKPMNATHLLELPMHVMDTALFYPTYLGLSSEEAAKRVDTLIENAMRLGGVLTFNWHDRSIAAERLWGDFYARLLDTLKGTGAWCTSATRVVTWFQKRRSVAFRKSDRGMEVDFHNVAINTNDGGPSLRVRVYNSQGSTEGVRSLYVDIALTIDHMCVTPRAASCICS